MPLPKLLFALKDRHDYWGQGGSDLSSGLLNSVGFLIDMLNANGVAAKMVSLVDANKIDKAIWDYQPNVCFIEAVWVLPAKVAELQMKWPHVHFAVRNHSELAFLASEGAALERITGYLQLGVEVTSNSPRAAHAITIVAQSIGEADSIATYLPNYYPVDAVIPTPHRALPGVVRVGAFGAIRPLKNHLETAVAAIDFAQRLGKRLEYHINATRIEMQGAPILKNLQGLFDQTWRATLVPHGWLDHAAFLELLTTMDFAVCASFSETFCIVAADAVRMGCPLVASKEVPWLGPYGRCDPNSAASITSALLFAQLQIRNDPTDKRLALQAADLARYSAASKKIWLDRFGP